MDDRGLIPFKVQRSCPDCGSKKHAGGRPAKPLAQRFWAFVEKGPDCWTWIGPVNGRHGYGKIGDGSPDNRTLAAHRVSWEIHNGPIPEGMEVCHSCDAKYPPGDPTYRRCVNPAHLFLGTRQENNADMMAKGRESQGEKHPGAKLSAGDVTEIRRLYAAGGVTHAQLAAKFGVSKGSVNFILNRKKWKAVP